MRSIRVFGVISLIVALAVGCGGGGGGGSPVGGSPTSSGFSGVAVDGYLFNARAFLDLNGNGTYDVGEPTSLTGTDGSFNLSATQDQINSHSVIVQAISGTTIDQDNPNTPLSAGFTMIAPAGYPSVVSPLTTHVAAKMATGLSIDSAKSAVQSELGLTSIDVMKNFVAEKTTNAAYADAHKVAVSVAEILKTVDSNSNSSTSMAEKLSSMSTKVTSQVVPQLAQIKASITINEAKNVTINIINTVSAATVYNLAGSINGLTSSGLTLSNGTDNFSPASNATSFTFKNKLANTDVYEVKIKNQPDGQICSLSNGFGSINNQSVTNISVRCVDAPGALGGLISGLTTSGLILKNGSTQISINSGANSFLFQEKINSGDAYAVSVHQQPVGKTCSISAASGVMVRTGVSNLQVTCSANSYKLSGSISGLESAGLILTNGTEIKSISTSATTFEFDGKVAYGGTYTVSVQASPTGYTCSTSNSIGTVGAADVTSVQVSCSINYFQPIRGMVNGLTTSGLKITSGSETINIAAGATSFNFSSRIAYGSGYSVVVSGQPSDLTCLIGNGSGIATGDIQNISITCTGLPYVSTFASGFYIPMGMVIDSKDNIYVAEQGNNKISKITKQGVVTTFAGSGEASSIDGVGVNASFNNPYGLVNDSQDNLFVSEFLGNKIRKITPTGAVTTFAGTGRDRYRNGPALTAEFTSPSFMSIDEAGNIYFLEAGPYYHVRKITVDGTVSTYLSCASEWDSYNYFVEPNLRGYEVGVCPVGEGGISVVSGGMYITQNKKLHFLPNNGPATILSDRGSDLMGVAIDQRTGDIYFAEPDQKNNILKISNGSIKVFAGASASGSNTSIDGYTDQAVLVAPMALVFDRDGNLYVSQRDGRIRKITFR